MSRPFNSFDEACDLLAYFVVQSNLASYKSVKKDDHSLAEQVRENFGEFGCDPETVRTILEGINEEVARRAEKIQSHMKIDIGS